MAVQASQNNTNKPFILTGAGQTVNDAIFAQDGVRAIPLAPYTVVSKQAASQKWVPYTDVAAIDGTATPKGVFIGPAISAADLVAGDVEGQVILIGTGIQVDVEQIVLENALVLTAVITAVPWASTETIKDVLHINGIDVEDTVAISEFENA